jgi:hypothetical protein
MSTPLRIVGFLAVLAVAFVAAFGVGRVVDPVRDPAAPPSMERMHGDG